MELRNNQRVFLRELQWERADTVLQLAVVAPALAMVVGLVVSWPNVPERVPMHFDALGPQTPGRERRLSPSFRLHSPYCRPS